MQIQMFPVEKNELDVFSIIAVVIVLQLFIYFVPIQRMVMKCYRNNWKETFMSLKSQERLT